MGLALAKLWRPDFGNKGLEERVDGELPKD